MPLEMVRPKDGHLRLVKHKRQFTVYKVFKNS